MVHPRPFSQVRRYLSINIPPLYLYQYQFNRYNNNTYHNIFISIYIYINNNREIVPAIEKAFQISQAGVPGPVFIEVPLDILYKEATTREWYNETAFMRGSSLFVKAVNMYIRVMQ